MAKGVKTKPPGTLWTGPSADGPFARRANGVISRELSALTLTLHATWGVLLQNRGFFGFQDHELKAILSGIKSTSFALHVRRLKGGIASVHPIQGDELRSLRELRRNSVELLCSRPMTRSNLSKMIEAAHAVAAFRAMV